MKKPLPGRWKVAIIVSCVFFAIAVILICVLLAPSSTPPNISLAFEGFAGTGTNVEARIRFTNAGKNSVWWQGGAWVFPENSTNAQPSMGVWLSGVPTRTPPSSNFDFFINVPPAYEKWHVTAEYIYYKQFPAKVLFTDWFFFHDRPTSAFMKKCFGPVFWGLNHLPEPKAQIGQASTPLLTNKPPATVRNQ